MTGGSSSNDEPITGINVTPLVDITLVLLIIFMVTAKLIVSHHALNVDLPPATTGGAVQQDVLSVVLAPSGAATVDGRAVDSDDALLGHARSARAANPALRVVIQADGSVPHRRVMRVLDLLRQARVTKIGFGVVPEPASMRRP